ncbi:MAG TPA: tRNA lysidine(34) synthetase TilS, partial [Longilinea sp.]|nr:tRNA lysidine(34) synthetase TilS [Longilinea sp.]
VNMGEVLRQDAVLIDETLSIAWKECVKTEDPKWIIINRTMVNTKNIAVRRMLLRQVMNQLAPDLRDLDYQVVERGIQFIQEPGEARRMDLLAGWEMAVWLGDILIHQTGIFPDDPHIPCMAIPELLVTSPGSVDLGGGWHFYAADREEPDHQGLDPFPTDTLSIWLDAEEVDFPLTIRTVQAGDRFNPLGMGSQTQKVSDVFTNAHIPAPYRTKWPLVFSRDKLIWIPGIKPAEFCRVKKSTRKILALRVEKVDQ